MLIRCTTSTLEIDAAARCYANPYNKTIHHIQYRNSGSSPSVVSFLFNFACLAGETIDSANVSFALQRIAGYDSGSKIYSVVHIFHVFTCLADLVRFTMNAYLLIL